jgi:hypothetical protein
MAEPEWDEQTRSLVLELARLDLCPVCGGPAEECQNPENQDRYTVPDPIRCHRQTAILRKQKGITEDTNPQHMALMWRAVLPEDRS